jgi:hypothetical protein
VAKPKTTTRRAAELRVKLQRYHVKESSNHVLIVCSDGRLVFKAPAKDRAWVERIAERMNRTAR